MDEYIRKDAAIELLSKPVSRSKCMTADEAMKRWNQREIDAALIRAIPAEDVRHVVLCKDCKYSCREDENELWCLAFSPGRLIRNDDYCSHGRTVQE